MANIIAYFIAGLSTTAFLILWFIISYKAICSKKNEVKLASEQIKMHTLLHIEAKYGPDEKCAKKMLETSHMIYDESIEGYNKTLHKLIYFIPGLIMGYRKINKEDKG